MKKKTLQLYAFVASGLLLMWRSSEGHPTVVELHGWAVMASKLPDDPLIAIPGEEINSPIYPDVASLVIATLSSGILWSPALRANDAVLSPQLLGRSFVYSSLSGARSYGCTRTGSQQVLTWEGHHVHGHCPREAEHLIELARPHVEVLQPINCTWLGQCVEVLQQTMRTNNADARTSEGMFLAQPHQAMDPTVMALRMRLSKITHLDPSHYEATQ
eukprot:gene8509-1523_t